MNERSEPLTPRAAWWLGLGGLVPFAAGSTAGFASDPVVADAALRALATYGAVILSFLGGVRWGAVLRDEGALSRWAPLTLSIVPSLVAWIALLLPPAWTFVLLFAGLVGQFLLDSAASRRGELPSWYARLRVVLTAGASAALAAGWVAVVMRQ